jgi:hypothetical protein
VDYLLILPRASSSALAVNSVKMKRSCGVLPVRYDPTQCIYVLRSAVIIQRDPDTLLRVKCRVGDEIQS